MLTRVLLATLLLTAAPLAVEAAPHHRHPAARVSIATYRTSTAHKPHRDLRAGHAPRHTRLAASQPRHHPLSRGS